MALAQLARQAVQRGSLQSLARCSAGAYAQLLPATTNTLAPTAAGLSRFFSSVSSLPVTTYNPDGKYRVVVTKELPGERWLQVLTGLDCRVEVCTSEKVILDNADIKGLIGTKCDGVIGQLTEDWGDELFGALAGAGGKAYSNYAVGYNNVDVPAGTKHNISVGNTPGVLTETTAEIAAALTLSAARRVVEADNFMRAGKYEGWLPTLFVGNLLQRKTVGIIGAGRIGFAYAKMMVEGHKMNIVYYDMYQNKNLESYFGNYSKFLEANGEEAITVTRAESIEDLLKVSDVVSLHTLLDKSTHHLINAEKLNIMKEDAVLVNAARGPIIDEVALVAHLKKNPNFRAGLDVFEDEPLMKPGLAECENAVIVPHIASASLYTRSAMAALAACNVATQLQGFPVLSQLTDVEPYISTEAPLPSMSPSIVNVKELSLPTSS